MLLLLLLLLRPLLLRGCVRSERSRDRRPCLGRQIRVQPRSSGGGGVYRALELKQTPQGLALSVGSKRTGTNATTAPVGGQEHGRAHQHQAVIRSQAAPRDCAEIRVRRCNGVERRLSHSC
jgi:hypothetical protein